MLISNLLKCIPEAEFKCEGDIKGIVTDSRAVKPGSLFVCIKGIRFDGHNAANEALSKGAVAVVVERDLGIDKQILVSNTRNALAKLCSEYFGRPQDRMKMVAVTGTNGKTTVATIVRKAMEIMGCPTGFIGTVGISFGDITLPARYTTPEPWELEAFLNKMESVGCKHVIMEASSQALDQGRLDDIFFDVAAFTNFSQDHLDYHKTFENYLAAKKLLFKRASEALINIDDEAGREIASELTIPYYTYSMNEEAYLTCKNVKSSFDGVELDVCCNGEECHCHLPLPGIFSAYNCLTSVGIMLQLGFKLQDICDALGKVDGVDGRSEVLYNGDVTVIDDYANTPTAMVNTFKSLKPYTKGRLIALFGCAGKRDKAKRVLMTEAICEVCDHAVFSGDNPRDEDPFEIMRPLLHIAEDKGVPYTLIPDRYWAIKYMLTTLHDGDVLILCCKGQEDYQVLNDITVYQDERRIVREYFKNRDCSEGK